LTTRPEGGTLTLVPDPDISAVLDVAQSKAGATFDAKVKSGASLGDAAAAALQTGGAVAGAAACAATGVGAIAAPLCGAVGGWLAGKVAQFGKTIDGFFDSIFGPSEEYKRRVHDIHINENDVRPDPAHVGTLYTQLGIVDYLLMQQLSGTLTVLGRAVQDFDMVPDGDKILAWLSRGLNLVHLSDVHTASEGWIWIGPVPSAPEQYPQWKWDGSYRAPSFTDAASAILRQWGSGAITNKAAADNVQELVEQSKAWSTALSTQAAKYLVLLATDITVREGLTTTDTSRYAPHVADPNAARVAAMQRSMAAGLGAPKRFRDSYLIQFGVFDSIQFLRRGV
jgi:hypothetical protein